MGPVVLDTDILSEILKGVNLQVKSAAQSYIATHKRFSFSDFTYYEIVRGLQARRKGQQLAAFLQMEATCQIFNVDRDVLVQAAQLWSQATLGGHPKSDSDLIIAATALRQGRPLVTGNTAHYAWIAGLQLINWRVP